MGGPGLHGHNGGFAQDDAAVLHIDEGVGGTEIDADVTGEKAEDFAEHGDDKGKGLTLKIELNNESRPDDKRDTRPSPKELERTAERVCNLKLPIIH